jgi:hypothetical protein
MTDKATEKPKGTVTADAEVKAMATITKAFATLDDATAARVLAWLNGRSAARGRGER